MSRAMYLTSPLLQLSTGAQPTQDVGHPSTTFLGREGLGQVSLAPPVAPPPVPGLPAVPQPPDVQRAGISW